MLLVMINHIGLHFDSHYFTPFGGIGVSMFLIASGYGLNESFKKKGLSGYWKNNIFRVFMPYFVVCLIEFIPHAYSWGDFLLDITFLKPTSWFMRYLFVSYIAFWCIHKVGLLQKYKYICFALFSIIMFFRGDSPQQAASFFIGILLSKNSGYTNKISKISTIATFGFLSITALAIKQLPVIRNANYIIYWVDQIAICLFAAIALLGLTYVLQMMLNSYFLSFCGNASLELYLVHTGWLWIIGGAVISVVDITYFIVSTMLISLVFYIFNKNIQSFILEMKVNRKQW